MADWLDGLILAKARDPKDGRWSGAATAPGTLIAALEDAIGTWIDKLQRSHP